LKHRNNVKNTRKDKETEGGFVRGVKKEPKPQWNESYGIHNFTLTESQDRLRNKIIDNDFVVCEAPAGTGKSLSVLYSFVKEYIADSTKEIVIIRTPVQVGLDDVGHLPSSLEDKISFHFESTKTLLEQLLTKGKVETDMGHRIHFKIPNFMLGATLDNTLLLIDEAQQMSPLILKLLLERVGLNSKVVICGDNSQMYANTKGRNALRDLTPRFFKNVDGELVPKYPNCAYHKFDVEDVQRSEFVKTVIRAYST
jgi:phosphate starvation-inducible PhoH-like protein